MQHHCMSTCTLFYWYKLVCVESQEHVRTCGSNHSLSSVADEKMYLNMTIFGKVFNIHMCCRMQWRCIWLWTTLAPIPVFRPKLANVTGSFLLNEKDILCLHNNYTKYITTVAKSFTPITTQITRYVDSKSRRLQELLPGRRFTPISSSSKWRSGH